MKKRILQVLVAIALPWSPDILAGLKKFSGLLSPAAETTSSPVTVEMVSPLPGSVLSNTANLVATASSTAAPIERVEFYETHIWTNYATHQVFTVTNLLGVGYPKPPAPRGFDMKPL